MVCIFAIYSQKCSKFIYLIHLHLLIFWSYISGISSYSSSSHSYYHMGGGCGGVCPMRSTTSIIHKQFTSISKKVISSSSSSSISSTSSTSSSSLDSSTSTFSSSSTSSSIFHNELRDHIFDYNINNTINFENYITDKEFLRGKENLLESKKRKKRKDNINDELLLGHGSLDIVVIGLSHHTAPVDVREKLSIPEISWNEASAELCDYETIKEAAVLSTCNRFEMYLVGRNQYEIMKDALDYLRKRTNNTLDEEILRKSLFILSGEDAIWHLMRVTAGLDSIVIGEGQILSQVKRAYQKSIEDDGSSGQILSAMMKSCILAGQRVRSETEISKGAVSVSSAAVEFILDKLQHQNVLTKQNNFHSLKTTIIGAGKMTKLLLAHLRSHKVKSVTIINRSPDSVNLLKNEFPEMEINYVPFSNMWTSLKLSDIIYVSTASTTPLIDASDLKTHLIDHQNPRNYYFVDISVPRNIHADCYNLISQSQFPSNTNTNFYIYNVDDLNLNIKQNKLKRMYEIINAENIIKDEILKYEIWKENLNTLPTINKLQNKAEIIRKNELNKVIDKLANLNNNEINIINNLSKGIVTSLLKDPLNHLKRCKAMKSTKEVLLQLTEAFQLE